ncbi:MAG: hypothetical protein N2323_06570 [candidate division WOR-3 bacterium]|nr:hypothetical protein [candidate division WOR-3 bacterium]
MKTYRRCQGAIFEGVIRFFGERINCLYTSFDKLEPDNIDNILDRFKESGIIIEENNFLILKPIKQKARNIQIILDCSSNSTNLATDTIFFTLKQTIILVGESIPLGVPLGIYGWTNNEVLWGSGVLRTEEDLEQFKRILTIFKPVYNLELMIGPFNKIFSTLFSAVLKEFYKVEAEKHLVNVCAYRQGDYRQEKCIDIILFYFKKGGD